MSKHKETIGNRMKEYENCYRFYLPKRQAVIVRLDGRAFHTFTKGFARPYDKLFASAMWSTAKQLCENISGVRFAYTQSDEISLVLVDYENINTEPWFGNNLQKIVSVCASMATIYFHEAMSHRVFDMCYSWSNLDWNNKEEMRGNYQRLNYMYGTPLDPKEFDKYNDTIQRAHNDKLAVFDCRAFIIPREEVVNYFYWRQLDCTRNSIQLTGQANFSHNQLQGKNCDEIQEMLWQEHGINWANEPNWFKNGVSIYKHPVMIDNTNSDLPTLRYKWKIDTETPIFTQDRNYINKHINFEE